MTALRYLKVKKEEQVSDSELTADERRELRELLYNLRIDDEIAKRRLARIAWIKQGALWFLAVGGAMLFFRDMFSGIYNFMARFVSFIATGGN